MTYPRLSYSNLKVYFQIHFSIIYNELQFFIETTCFNEIIMYYVKSLFKNFSCKPFLKFTLPHVFDILISRFCRYGYSNLWWYLYWIFYWSKLATAIRIEELNIINWEKLFILKIVSIFLHFQNCFKIKVKIG